jgi:Family of unknown function (DUF5320)
MPDFDGTGPLGEGPLTGRRKGRCRGSKSKQNEQQKNPESKTNETGFGKGRRSAGGRQGRSGQNAGKGRREN